MHHNLDDPFVWGDMPKRGPNRTCTYNSISIIAMQNGMPLLYLYLFDLQLFVPFCARMCLIVCGCRFVLRMDSQSLGLVGGQATAQRVFVEI